MLDLIQDALLDTVKLLPFLYLTYLVMEYLEHHLEGHTDAVMKKAGRFGPLVGGLLGVVPQCGFSTVAANLYAGRIITIGTLLAVFLSTSDEMLPIMISRQVPAGLLVKFLVLKASIAVAAGFLIDAAYRRRGRTPSGSIGEICDHEHCHCEKSSPFMAALRHTVSIGLFILLINFLIAGPPSGGGGCADKGTPQRPHTQRCAVGRGGADSQLCRFGGHHHPVS